MKGFGKLAGGMFVLACVSGIGWAAGMLNAAAAESRRELVTLAGVPGNGFQNGIGQSARFASPLGIDVHDGSILIADTDNDLLRSYHGDRVTTVAGAVTEKDSYGNALGGYYDTTPSSALFSRPADCLYLSDGRIAVADRENHAIRLVSSSWVYTLNGTGEEGYAEGTPGKALFSSPSGLAEGKDGSIYVADTGNHCIRRITRAGATSLVAGVPGSAGLKDGAAKEALFMEPVSVAVGEDGSIYVSDSGNQRIRRIKNGKVTTLAGGSIGNYLDTEYLAPGYADGQGEEAVFWFPSGICMAGDTVIVADTGNHLIRAISPEGQVRTIAGNGDAGYGDGAALETELNRPGDVAWADNTLYIMDTGNSALRSMYFNPETWLESLGEGTGQELDP